MWRGLRQPETPADVELRQRAREARKTRLIQAYGKISEDRQNQKQNLFRDVTEIKHLPKRIKDSWEDVITDPRANVYQPAWDPEHTEQRCNAALEILQQSRERVWELVQLAGNCKTSGGYDIIPWDTESEQPIQQLYTSVASWDKVTPIGRVSAPGQN